jgi:hypothetical protein
MLGSLRKATHKENGGAVFRADWPGAADQRVRGTLSSVALRFFVRVFSAICGEYTMAVVGGTRTPIVSMARSMKIGGRAHEFWKRGGVERSCELDATCITDFKRGERAGARG